MRFWGLAASMVAALGCQSGKDDTGAVVVTGDLDGDGAAAPEDCNDDDPTVHPGADEVCNGADDDCDGDVDEDPVDATSVYYDDMDRDGYGDPTAGSPRCGLDTGHVADNGDCNDGHAYIYPGADEVCNSVDDDCDGEIDEDPVNGHDYHVDADLDAYGDPDVTARRCRATIGVTADDSDCDDTRDDVNPSAPELCDLVDNDCNGEIDDDAYDQRGWFADNDGDGYGTRSEQLAYGCAGPEGSTDLNGDCDDNDPDRAPGLPELCDGIDNDCINSGSDENGTATYFPDGGAAIDLVAALGAGAEGSPIPYAVGGGVWNMCGVTLYVNLTVTTSTTFVSLRGTSLLSGGGVGTVMSVIGDRMVVTVEGIDIKDGNASVVDPVTTLLAGGGLACIGASTIALTNAEVDDSDAEIGGNVYAYGCDLSFTDGTINDGSALYGGGLYAEGASIRIERMEVAGNYASSTGGGLAVSGALTPAVLALVDSEIDYNVAQDGGGLSVSKAVTATCTVSPSLTGGFRTNTARTSAGAVLLDGAGSDISFASVGCDFAEDGAIDDNQPWDVWITDAARSYSYANAATFVCSQSGCE